VTTGISAYDRATTILAIANPHSSPEDLIQPGHVFPLRAKDGGVLRRAGHTEAAVDLAKLAGLQPAGRALRNFALTTNDGALAGADGVPKQARTQNLHDQSLIAYRRKREKLVELEASGETADRLRRLRSAFVSIASRRDASSRAGEGKDRQEQTGAGAGAQ